MFNTATTTNYRKEVKQDHNGINYYVWTNVTGGAIQPAPGAESTMDRTKLISGPDGTEATLPLSSLRYNDESGFDMWHETSFNAGKHSVFVHRIDWPKSMAVGWKVGDGVWISVTLQAICGEVRINSFVEVVLDVGSWLDGAEFHATKQIGDDPNMRGVTLMVFGYLKSAIPSQVALNYTVDFVVDPKPLTIFYATLALTVGYARSRLGLVAIGDAHSETGFEFV